LDWKSRNAGLLADEQNKKVKGEFETINPIDAQMEETVQDMRHNVIKSCLDIIAVAHKIVDNMSMYVKKLVATQFYYLLDNDNTNVAVNVCNTHVAVDVDDDDETQLAD
jgi:hypothetical protein